MSSSSSSLSNTNTNSGSAPPSSSINASSPPPIRKLPFRSYWFICDLDGTLVPSPFRQEGAHLPLTRSPCNAPVAAWLRGGGNLAVISTAGTNLFRQILHPLSKTEKAYDFKGSLILCGFSGAAMFRLRTRSWEKVKELDAAGAFHMEEVTEYRYYGGPNGSTTCVSNAVCQDVFTAAVELYRKMFELFEQDESRIELLSKRYRVPFKKLLEIRKKYSKEGKIDQFNNEYMNGKVLTRKCDIIDRVPLICFQAVPRAESHSSSSYTFEEHQKDEDFVIAQISFLGVPEKLFPLLFLSPSSTKVLPPQAQGSRARYSSLSSYFKEKLGLKVVCQPNSVAIVKYGVDKGCAIQWMLHHPEGFANISPLRCIAVGDQPQNVDATMMRFSSKFTIPFFSVGKPLLSSLVNHLTNNNRMSANNIEKNEDDARVSFSSLPREVRLAIENGGFVDFGDIVNSFEEHGTAILLMFAMDYLESASTLIHQNLVKFTSQARQAATSSCTSTSSKSKDNNNEQNFEKMIRGHNSSTTTLRSSTSSFSRYTDTMMNNTVAAGAAAASARVLTHTLASSGELRMPTVERIMADLQMDGDRTSMRRRALQLMAKYEQHQSHL